MTVYLRMPSQRVRNLIAEALLLFMTFSVAGYAVVAVGWVVLPLTLLALVSGYVTTSRGFLGCTVFMLVALMAATYIADLGGARDVSVLAASMCIAAYSSMGHVVILDKKYAL